MERAHLNFGAEIRTLVQVWDIPPGSLGVILGVSELGGGGYEYGIGIYKRDGVIMMNAQEFEMTGRENAEWE